MYDSNIIKLPCAAHRLNLSVNDIFKPKSIKTKNNISYIYEYNERDELRKTEISPEQHVEIDRLNLAKVQVIDLIRKCKHLVGSFHSSDQLSRRLRDKQVALNTERPHRLVQDVVTRWNSTFDMFCSLLENELPLKAMQVLIFKLFI